MKKLASLLLFPAVMLMHAQSYAADAAQAPEGVGYSLTILEGGKATVNRQVRGTTGMVMAMSGAEGDESVTTCKFHGKDVDSSIENRLTVGDSYTMSLFPAAGEDGKVDALVSVTVGHGTKQGVASVSGCVFTEGTAHEDTVSVDAILKVGESKAIDLGAGKTLVIKREKV